MAHLSLVSLVGCSNGQDSYYPLKGNQTWHYDVVRTTMDGTTNRKHIIESLEPMPWRSKSATPKRTIAGNMYLYQSNEHGIQRIAYKKNGTSEFMNDDPPRTVLPTELAVGRSWRQPGTTTVLENSGPPWETLYRIVEEVELEYTIESISDAVKVPVGSFNDCVRVRARGQTNADVGNYIGRAVINVDRTDWYAPNIGLVKSILVETTDAEALNRGTQTLELERYYD